MFNAGPIKIRLKGQTENQFRHSNSLATLVSTKNYFIRKATCSFLKISFSLFQYETKCDFLKNIYEF